MKQFLSAGLSLLRGVTGDDAYEKYVAHMKRTQPEERPMSAEAFFSAQLEQKWNCVNGCC
ncbi:MAG: hypothetical protein RL030_2481 [Pseudomonadota bacterium]|jgi:uncharacterized short protein YbdD (DUF466 family)